MPPSERSPLLENGNHRGPFSQRALAFLRGDNQPGWLVSLRFLVLGSWLNILLVFVPLSAIAHHLNWDAGLRFSFSFIAIMPLAGLLGEATEQLSLKLGQTLGALLNASFGNAVEIIVGVAALLQGQLRIVQTSMLGSILSNLLLVLGCSFFAGGLKFKESNFKVTAAQTSSSLMSLAGITLVIPAAYHSSKVPRNGNELNNLLRLVDDPTGPPNPSDGTTPGLLIISRGTALALFFMYLAYLYFQLVSHSYLFQADTTRQTGTDEREELEEEEEQASMSLIAATVSLLAVTVVTSFCADYLVASIEETAETYHIPKPFIGVILIPIVANAAEHFTAIWMAMKGKMELTIGIAIGSSIQIATFVVPLLVIIGWITGHELTLYFADFETIVLFVTILLTDLLINDGKSNYLEGLMLITLYLVIGLAFWVS